MSGEETRNRLGAIALVRAAATGDDAGLNDVLRRAYGAGEITQLMTAVLELAANTALSAAKWRGTTVEHLLEGTEFAVMRGRPDNEETL